MYALNSAHVKLDVEINRRTYVEYSTCSVEDATEAAFNSNMPNLIDLDVELHMHLIRKLNSAHVECDV